VDARRVVPALRVGVVWLLARWRLWWVAAAINALLLVVFFWSRPGSTTTLRLEVVGSDFRAYVDGKLHGQASYDDYPAGGIGLQLSAANGIPSLPGPSKLKSVRVTDAVSGAVLFQDSFDGEDAGPWVASQGKWVCRGGAYWSPTGGMATTGYQPWRDYVLEATFSNLTQTDFFVRVQDNGDGVVFSFRPYRNFDSAFFLRKGGSFTEAVGGRTVELSSLETVRSMLGTALRPYPTLGLLALGAVLVIGVSRLVSQDRRLARIGRWLARRLAEPAAWGAAIAAFGILLYLNYVVGDHMPHVPDSVAYLFQARIFASFHLFAKAPELGEHFAFPGSVIQYAGRWFSQYPFGHPLALAVGVRFGAPWLIPPLLGALTVLLVYRVGSHVYGTGTGLLAAALMLLSPFFQMTASNFMSHNTAAFYLMAGTFFFLRPTGRPALSWFVSGVFLGLLLNTRPLTAAGVLVPFALWSAYDLWKASDRRAFFRQALALAAGFGLLLCLYFLYNRALTGSFTRPPYALGGTFTRETLGFFGRHSLAAGLMNDQTNLSLLVLVLNGWPLSIGLLFVLLPFILGSRNRWDYFFLTGAFLIAAAWTTYEGVFIMHGPRFWYEMVPFLMLLSARGVQCLVTFVGDVASWLGARIHFLWGLESRAAAGLAAYGLVAVLLAYSVHGWMLGKHDAWPYIEYVPRKVSELKDFNSANPGLLEEVERQHLHNALVFVHECSQWWCYGSVFWKNSPDLNGDIVYAHDLGPEKNAALIERYPGRNVYLADYDRRTVEPYAERAPAPPSPTPVPKPTPTPTSPSATSVPKPTPTEDSAARAERDARRQEDLKRIGDALEEYRARFGSYPSSGGGFQTLCAYATLDAGCALLEVVPAIPQDPLGDPLKNGYWYASDGERFTILAIREGEGPSNLSACYFYHPGASDPRVGLCLSGGAPLGGPTEGPSAGP
jgi:hypothetical protein